METTDSQILSTFSDPASKEKGFRMLMEKYQERLYWLIRKMVIDHEDANDVLQNVFIKVWKNLHRFKGNAQLYTWLYRIATNETYTFLKDKRKRTTSSLEDETNELSNRLKADDYFRGDDIQEMLQRAIATLPDKQKMVFNLRYFEEMPYEEMSEALETSVGALKASYHHAVKKVESFLKDQLNR